MELEYKSINNLSWDEILRHNCREWHAPLTVHMPIHSEHSSDWIMVDPALNAARLRVLPGQYTGMPDEERKARKNLEVMMVQFALDDPPFVPDFHCTGVELEEGRLPVVRAWHYAADIKYVFEYFCRPLDRNQSILWITGTLSNEDESVRTACVRARVCFLPESEIFNHHYAPFYWDAGKYLPCPGVSLEGDKIIFNGKEAGKAIKGGFKLSWEEENTFRDEDYNRLFNCSRPYFVSPAMRVKDLRQAVCFSAELPPGESRGFAIAVLTDYENASESHLKTLASEEPGEGRKALTAHFRAGRDEKVARMECPAGRWGDIFIRMQTMINQMLVRFPGEPGLVPYQGGTTERHFVWVWEAVIMLEPLLSLGRFSAVREALEYIFSLQDGGCPPEGELTTTEGSVGTTGPRWLCTTGAALALASDYFRYSGDAEFLNEFLEKMFRAADWIKGEIRATRKMNPDGTRPPWYGLMPSGCATDGDIGHIVAKTDGFTFWGLNKFAELLNDKGHGRAGEFLREAELYRRDIEAAVKEMTKPDGYIERKILTGKEKKIQRRFEFISGAQQLFYTGVLDVEYPGLKAFMEFFENNVADGPFLGRLDSEKIYIGNSECYWQDIYLKMGEWKKAFLTFQTYLKYGLTEETFLVQERFSKLNPAFTPWQPNGSGSGRVLEMMIKSFYFGNKGEAVLFGGIPFARLKDNERTAVKGLYTPGGRVSVEAEMLGDGKCRVILSADSPPAMPKKVKIPGFLRVESASGGLRSTDGVFSVPEGSLRAEFQNS
jgi:hypothetical protein